VAPPRRARRARRAAGVAPRRRPFGRRTQPQRRPPARPAPAPVAPAPAACPRRQPQRQRGRLPPRPRWGAHGPDGGRSRGGGWGTAGARGAATATARRRSRVPGERGRARGARPRAGRAPPLGAGGGPRAALLPGERVAWRLHGRGPTRDATPQRPPVAPFCVPRRDAAARRGCRTRRKHNRPGTGRYRTWGEPRRTGAHDMACYPPVAEQKRWPVLLARVSGHCLADWVNKTAIPRGLRATQAI